MTCAKRFAIRVGDKHGIHTYPFRVFQPTLKDIAVAILIQDELPLTKGIIRFVVAKAAEWGTSHIKSEWPIREPVMIASITPPGGRTTPFASPKTHVSRYRRLYLVVDNVSHAPHVESQHTLIREIINRLMISGERMVIARIH
jgi:hypothetical protein